MPLKPRFSQTAQNRFRPELAQCVALKGRTVRFCLSLRQAQFLKVSGMIPDKPE